MNHSVICVEHLTKSFRKGHIEQKVLKDISLNIHSGEVIGYLGSNGAGKSTTVKILCGILPDFEGNVNVLGYDIRKDPLTIKHHISYIPENAVMYEHLTPMEYLEFVGTLYGLHPEIAREKASQMLTLFEMQEHAHVRMVTFSKGMKQKVHIISGLLHNPDLLFMDEPLNGLDANAVIQIKEMIAELSQQGKTVFYCSHLMDIVEKIASRIILIQDGFVLANGTLAELEAKAETRSLENIFAKLTNYKSTSE